MTAPAIAGSVRDALGGAVDALEAAGVESPRLDAELLLCGATGWDRAQVAANPKTAIPATAGRRFAEMVRRRLRREPVAYVLGRKGFRHVELAVDRRVLIPRPETELLVELALELRPRRLLDVGTGSGAIALAVAEELPGCEVVATDTSPAALEVARLNVQRLGLVERVELVEGTLPLGQGKFDLVLANLPYVSEGEWGGLEPEVTEWEPREALLGGADGLDAIRALLARCVRGYARIAGRSANGATLDADAIAFEVGSGQAGAVGDLLRRAGFGAVEARRDLAGVERVVLGRRGAP